MKALPSPRYNQTLSIILQSKTLKLMRTTLLLTIIRPPFLPAVAGTSPMAVLLNVSRNRKNRSSVSFTLWVGPNVKSTHNVSPRSGRYHALLLSVHCYSPWLPKNESPDPFQSQQPYRHSQVIRMQFNWSPFATPAPIICGPRRVVLLEGCSFHHPFFTHSEQERGTPFRLELISNKVTTCRLVEGNHIHQAVPGLPIYPRESGELQCVRFPFQSG